jgi:hypothetical protein
MSESTALAIKQEARNAIVPSDFESVMKFAELVHRSGLAPKSFDTPQKVAIGIMMNIELSRPVITGLQDLAVINGKCRIYGDAVTSQILASNLMEEGYPIEEEQGTPFTDNWTFLYKVKRKGRPEKVGRFTWVDAKRAGFDNPMTKDGRKDIWSPWTRFPRRMMQWKARQWVNNDEFGDVLKGVKTVEEAYDMVDMAEVSPGVYGTPGGPENVDPATGEVKPGKVYDFKKAPEPPAASQEEESAEVSAKDLLLNAIKAARPNRGDAAKVEFQKLYLDNAEFILGGGELTEQEHKDIRKKWELAGFKWEDFIDMVGKKAGGSPNQAEEQNTPIQGEKAQEEPGQAIGQPRTPDQGRPEPKNRSDWDAYLRAHHAFIIDKFAYTETDLPVGEDTYKEFLSDYRATHPQFQDDDHVLVTKWRHEKEEEFWGDYLAYLKSHRPS